jgi:hypothetical protein
MFQEGVIVLAKTYDVCPTNEAKLPPEIQKITGKIQANGMT